MLAVAPMPVAAAMHARAPMPAGLPVLSPELLQRLRLQWEGVVKCCHRKRHIMLTRVFMELRPTPADMRVLFGPGEHPAMRRRLDAIFNAETMHRVRLKIVQQMYTQVTVCPAEGGRFEGGALAAPLPLFSVVLSREDVTERVLQTRVRWFVFVNGHWVMIGH